MRKSGNKNLWEFSEVAPVRYRDKFFLLVLVIAGIASVFYFADWWFREKHISTLWFFILLSLFFSGMASSVSSLSGSTTSILKGQNRLTRKRVCVWRFSPPAHLENPWRCLKRPLRPVVISPIPIPPICLTILRIQGSGK